MLFKLAIALTALTFFSPRTFAAPVSDALKPLQAGDIEIEARGSKNNWHVHNLLANCGGGFCTYSFHLQGFDNGVYPNFEAMCAAKVGFDDESVHKCDLIRAGSQHNVDVTHAQASFRLRPKQRGPNSTKLVVQILMQDQHHGQFMVHEGKKSATYKDFSTKLTDFDVVPMYNKPKA